MGINTGAVMGQLATGYLGEKVGWHLGFGIAGVGMIIGCIWFYVRSKSTLGNLGLEPSRDPDPVKQAKQERTIKLSIAIGLGLLAVVLLSLELEQLRSTLRSWVKT
jgi:POT family proton-dependent oligopeptide transporter